MYFSKIFQILFIVVSTFLFFIIPECLKNLWWCFSSSFSVFEDQRRVFPPYLAPFSSRFMVLALCHPLIIFFDRENSFHPSGAFHEFFPFLSSEGHLFKYYSFSAFSSHSPNFSGASFKYSLISSGSLRSLASKFYQVSSFFF